MPVPIPCLVADDGTFAIVAGVRLDAAEVEDLIWRLAACRQAMAPRRLPVMFEGSRIVVGDAWQRTGDGMVAVHHSGLGWVGASAGDKRLVTTETKPPKARLQQADASQRSLKGLARLASASWQPLL